jgi:hypothetical protein
MVLAERVIDDSATHNLTLVSCLERVQALSFPSQHHGFAVGARFRCIEGIPKRDRKVRFRLVRQSEHESDEHLFDLDTTWAAGLSTARLATNFQVLRLKRPETLRFRLDYKVGRTAWQHGSTCYLDVVERVLTDDERRALREEAKARGLPTDGLD